MTQIYFKVLLIMGVLFAFTVPGFALKKLNLLGERAAFTLSNILLYVCQPALAISSFCALSREQWERVSDMPTLQLLKNFGDSFFRHDIDLRAVQTDIFKVRKQKKDGRVFVYSRFLQLRIFRRALYGNAYRRRPAGGYVRDGVQHRFHVFVLDARRSSYNGLF